MIFRISFLLKQKTLQYNLSFFLATPNNPKKVLSLRISNLRIAAALIRGNTVLVIIWFGSPCVVGWPFSTEILKKTLPPDLWKMLLVIVKNRSLQGLPGGVLTTSDVGRSGLQYTTTKTHWNLYKETHVLLFLIDFDWIFMQDGTVSYR